jgi:hypothetical protein
MVVWYVKDLEAGIGAFIMVYRVKVRRGFRAWKESTGVVDGEARRGFRARGESTRVLDEW